MAILLIAKYKVVIGYRLPERSLVLCVVGGGKMVFPLSPHLETLREVARRMPN